MEPTSNTPILRLREFVQWAQSNGLCSSFCDFERQCGLSNGYIAKSSLCQKGEISTSILTRIIKVYPMLNLAWLCTGEGGMFAEETRTDYYKAYREKCRELKIAKRKLEEIKVIVSKK